jgi:hypothetical protein
MGFVRPIISLNNIYQLILVTEVQCCVLRNFGPQRANDGSIVE